MKRREIMKLVGALAFAGSAIETSAQTMREMHPGKYKSLENSTAKCVATGEDCLRHCLGMFSMKDTSMSGCTNLVVQLIAACRALQTLASVNSTFTPTFAKDVAAVCTACEQECRKFYDKVSECRACADACKTCAAECRSVAA